MAVTDLRPHPRPTDHGQHDELRVVAWASGDLAGDEGRTASLQVDSCSECADLAADVTAVRRDLALLPAPARRRDFRLAPADAARARPSGWRSLLSVFATPRLAPSAPLGLALAVAGIVGLLVTAGPSLIPLGVGSGGEGAALSTGASPMGLEAAGASSDAMDAGRAAAPVAGTAGEASGPMKALGSAPEASPVSSGEAAPAPMVAAAPADGATADAAAAPVPGAAGSAALPENNGPVPAPSPTDGGAGLDPALLVSAVALVAGLLLLALRLGATRLSRPGRR